MMQDSEQTDSISIMKWNCATAIMWVSNSTRHLQTPGGDEDLEFADGDVLFIPQLVNTVKIQGDVMYPQHCGISEGQETSNITSTRLTATGLWQKRAKLYIVYLNGTVAKPKRTPLIGTGMQIIVPSKSPGKGVDWQAIMSIGTSAGALGTMAASIAALLR